ncbi:MAG: DNA polymerase III subunit gamma/tau [Alphaproteobacteria bacterium]|nr:MAG: DNA polymerase III subunit gamma/tau [Alphaproteobacteria bacterium]
MTDDTQEYRVLARKYRPQKFDELIGQEALVRTLTNAIESGRIAHAFMLTGVRGVGKTTTARIIAKALNYTGADGKAGATTGDTSDCEICQAIAEDRHPDVMEMDAASRTGVDDIREILDGVRYAPVSARYKIYVIDEVHMLSKNAFNALLKTLEEPPSHVKFIFATTEIRKVPVTVLSRCQRFDLRRVEVDTLKSHFEMISEKEGVKADSEALDLIARAADGSVRDGLSLLDQAMALGAQDQVTAEDVGTMLGATDRIRILDLIEASFSGQPQTALEIMQDLYRMGADSRVVIQDMMDMIHGLSILSVNTDATIESLPHAAMDKSKAMAAQMRAPQFQKAWQILLKGLGELNNAPNAQKAAEMVVLRLIYAADLPDPADLIKKLKNAPIIQNGAAPVVNAPADAGGSGNQPQLRAIAGGGMVAESVPVSLAVPQNQTAESPQTIEGMIQLFEDKGEMILSSHLYQDIACLSLKKGHFEFFAYPTCPPEFSSRVQRCLRDWTGEPWMLSVTADAKGRESVAAQKKLVEDTAMGELKSHPNITMILSAFPDAKIENIYTKEEEK